MSVMADAVIYKSRVVGEVALPIVMREWVVVPGALVGAEGLLWVREGAGALFVSRSDAHTEPGYVVPLSEWIARQGGDVSPPRPRVRMGPRVCGGVSSVGRIAVFCAGLLGLAGASVLVAGVRDGVSVVEVGHAIFLVLWSTAVRWAACAVESVPSTEASGEKTPAEVLGVITTLVCVGAVAAGLLLGGGIR